VPWFGTTRARIGYTGDSGALFYLTGGLAYGERKSNVTHIAGTSTAVVARDDTKAGWALGGGIEMPINTTWRVKAEYLYVDLGSETITFSLNPFQNVALTSKFRDNVFRLGVNYAFN
jgi:outer membrane immunogenic protein